MLCQFEKLIYPQCAKTVDISSYMIAIYQPCEKILDSAGNIINKIKAVGYCLPISENIRYNIQGHWSKNQKFGLQFEVENYEEVVIPNREGIVAYLSSGQIRGIGPVLADRIYNTFGDDTLEILDKDPQKLLSIHGISELKLQKIIDSYIANRGARDVVAFLVPHGITANRAVKLYREYGNKTMDIVKKHPYSLCEMAGIGFNTADKIAVSMGFDKLSKERLDEGLKYTLADAETKGHLCMEKQAFIRSCIRILNTEGITEEMLGERVLKLLQIGELADYYGNIYRAETERAEIHVADMIVKQLLSYRHENYGDIEEELDREEVKLKLKLAPEQREAVKTALSNGIAVVTGGPGTGKTLIQRAILDIYHNRFPDAEICCCAPTGRAARRMNQSTGYPASTVHKALGLFARDDGSFGMTQKLTADLILVDEISMLDIYLAGRLLDALKYGAKLILVGDSDQLPSVGPGAVLSEIINSGCVPVVKLDKVFRQSAGSRIATNAKLIRHGTLSLEYGEDFEFISSPELPESAEIISRLYLDEINRCGVDNVALLTPYRQKTETGVNALNQVLREQVNPSEPGKEETPEGVKKFRVGDKVMQTKNFEDVSNGDIGYVKHIYNIGNECTVEVDFGDGRIKEYDPSGGDLDMLDLGYASTVHKSQGSEYSTVIINLQSAHYIMLNRPLIYTAITRGKKKVIIVGERKALCTAIKRTETEKRGTCLANRLQQKRMGELPV